MAERNKTPRSPRNKDEDSPLPVLVSGSHLGTRDGFHYFITGVASRRRMEASLSSMYIPWNVMHLMLSKINTSAAASTPGTTGKPTQYAEIALYVKWRRRTPPEVSSRETPKCLELGGDDETPILNWRDEFIRVCVSMGHVWLTTNGSVLHGRPNWAIRKNKLVAEIPLPPPAIIYSPFNNKLLPLIWFDYDPWEGQFDIPAHSWPQRYDTDVAITLISSESPAKLTTSKLIVDLANIQNSRVSASSRSALTISVIWHSLSDDELAVPNMTVARGIKGVDFGVLLTYSNEQRGHVRVFNGLYYCQGVFNSKQPHPHPSTTASIVHACPYSKWEYASDEVTVTHKSKE